MKRGLELGRSHVHFGRKATPVEIVEHRAFASGGDSAQHTRQLGVGVNSCHPLVSRHGLNRNASRKLTQVSQPMDLWIGSGVMCFDLIVDHISAAHAPPCIQPQFSTLHIDIMVHDHETVTAFAAHPRSSS
jgi:hypothetical protein